MKKDYKLGGELLKFKLLNLITKFKFFKNVNYKGADGL